MYKGGQTMLLWWIHPNKRKASLSMNIFSSSFNAEMFLLDDSSHFNLNSHCLKEMNDLKIGFECGSFEPSIENVDLFNLGWIWF